jgi:hypothetical protein
VLERHTEQVDSSSPEEWGELHAHVQRSTERLRRTSTPDRFNYAFLLDQARDGASARDPALHDGAHGVGVRFEDPNYPGRYVVPAPARRVLAEVLDAPPQLLST